jgi:hypothetical protein
MRYPLGILALEKTPTYLVSPTMEEPRLELQHRLSPSLSSYVSQCRRFQEIEPVAISKRLQLHEGMTEQFQDRAYYLFSYVRLLSLNPIC